MSAQSNAQQEVNAPAILLMVVALVAVGGGLLGLALDAFLIASGAVAQLEAVNDGPISESTQITVRIIWGAILIMASCFVFYGALQMKQLKNYQIARSAAIVAAIPCLGPCCLLGIPFGVWALIVLNKPVVQKAFV